MKTHLTLSRMISLGLPALIAASSAMLAGQAIAQPAPGQSSVEEIYVVAPHTVAHKEVGHATVGMIGAPVEEITLTRRIGFADLDLRKQADVEALKARVADTATKGCKDLDQLYPPTNLVQPAPTPKSCFQAAMDGAMPQVVAAIEAANK